MYVYLRTFVHVYRNVYTIHILSIRKYTNMLQHVYYMCSMYTYVCVYINLHTIVFARVLHFVSIRLEILHPGWNNATKLILIHLPVYIIRYLVIGNELFLGCHDFFYVNWQTVFYTYNSFKLVMPFQLSGIDPVNSLL